jgi:SMI1-KNR4 cell-wall
VKTIEQWAMAFRKKFVHEDDLLARISDAQLNDSEAQLGSQFPAVFRRFILEVGPLHCYRTLDMIVDTQCDLADVKEIFSPHEMVTRTNDWWSVALPSDMYAFASGSTGDLFCFPVVGFDKEVVADCNVYFYDHEEEVTYDLEVTFAEWIAEFLMEAEGWKIRGA